MESNRSFGQSLRLYRQSRDLTQADLAEQVGCATESIRKLEANRQRPSRALVVRLADILVVPAEERSEFIYLARRRMSDGSLENLTAGGHNFVVNLPAQMTSLIGRRTELGSVSSLLRDPNVRLVTLTGPGGVGKTRLAAQVALDLLNDFPSGAFFVSLATISGGEFVPRAIAEVLHLRAAKDQFIARFAAYYRQKPILLILDNFEHVRSAAPLLADLLAAASQLRILITSRTTVGLYGENELQIQPLPTPNLLSLPASEELLAYDSVRIFVERTRAVKADFTLTEANSRAVAEICCRLDGLPLALELAAAYGKLLSPRMLLEHLKKEPLELSTAVPNLPERHSTLRNTIRWSYELLSPIEKSVFQQLSVFSGGFTLEAMEAVCSLQEGSALTYLGALLDKSLLQQMDVTLDERRYIMLDTLRAYASEQLIAEKGLDEAGRRHLTYHLKLAEENIFRLEGSYQWKWLERLEREIANLRTAIQWALEHKAGAAVVHLCSDLEYFWYEFGQPGELYQWMQAVLREDMNLSPEMKATALRFTGYVLMTMQIDYLQARMYFEKALELWQELEDKPEVADTLGQMGILMLSLGDLEYSQTLLQQCFQIWEMLGNVNGKLWALMRLGVTWIRNGEPNKAREVFEGAVKWWHQQGDLRAEAFTLNYLGVIVMHEQKFDLAHAYLDQALGLWQTIGDRRGASLSLNALGPVALHQGRPEEAFAFLGQSLTLRWESHDYNGMAWNLERLAEVAFAQKQWERGAQLWSAAQALRERCKSPLFPGEMCYYQPLLEAAQSKLGIDSWNASFATGHNASIELMVSYALEKRMEPV